MDVSGRLNPSLTTGVVEKARTTPLTAPSASASGRSLTTSVVENTVYVDGLRLSEPALFEVTYELLRGSEGME